MKKPAKNLGASSRIHAYLMARIGQTIKRPGLLRELDLPASSSILSTRLSALAKAGAVSINRNVSPMEITVLPPMKEVKPKKLGRKPQALETAPPPQTQINVEPTDLGTIVNQMTAQLQNYQRFIDDLLQLLDKRSITALCKGCYAYIYNNQKRTPKQLTARASTLSLYQSRLGFLLPQKSASGPTLRLLVPPGQVKKYRRRIKYKEAV